MPTDPSCQACRIVSSAERPPAGIVHREGGFLVHALAGASPIQGWLVLTSERHVRGWSDLDEAELVSLGPLVARIMCAQKSALGAEHVYAFAIGDLVKHFHLHLVPRYQTTPERLWGRGAFEARPSDNVDEAVLAKAALSVAAVL